MKDLYLQFGAKLVQSWGNSKGRAMKDIPHGNRGYDWDAWFDGKWRKLRQGTHFQCSPESFRLQVGSAARARGLRAVTRVLPNGIVAFQVCPKVASKSVG